MNKFKLLMVGNGMTGIRTIEELLKVAPDLRNIPVFAAEPHPCYLNSTELATRATREPARTCVLPKPTSPVGRVEWIVVSSPRQTAGKSPECKAIQPAKPRAAATKTAA
jgi:hypothetical protein